MDYSEEERQILLNASLKKLIAALNDLEASFDQEINRRFNVDDSFYSGYTQGFGSDHDGFAKVIVQQTEKHIQTEALLKRCENYMKPGVEPKCYEIMMLICKRRLEKIGVTLNYLNTLIQMASESNKTFVDFIDFVEKEGREIDLGEILGLGGKHDWGGGFNLGVLSYRS